MTNKTCEASDGQNSSVAEKTSAQKPQSEWDFRYWYAVHPLRARIHTDWAPVIINEEDVLYWIRENRSKILDYIVALRVEGNE